MASFPGWSSEATADPNWLLSSAAQSGAALVAIVGGLLASRLLTLRTERAAHARAAGQHAKRAVEARALRDELHQEVVREQTLGWLTACLGEVVRIFRASPNGLITVEQLRRIAQTPLADADVQPTVNEVMQDLRAASSEIRGALDQHGGGQLPPSWPKARAALGITHRERQTAVYEHVYAAERAERQRVAAQAESQGENATRRLAAVLASSTSTPTPSQLQDVTALATSMAALRDAQREVQRHELEQDLAEAAGSAVPATAKIKGALCVLAYMGVVNLLIPLGVLVQQPTEVDLWLRVSIFLLFLTGIAAMILYLTFGFRDEVSKE